MLLTFKMHSVEGTALLLEHKEHPHELLFRASFCLLLLKLFAQLSAGTCALFIYTAVIQSKSLHHSCAGSSLRAAPKSIHQDGDEDKLRVHFTAGKGGQ